MARARPRGPRVGLRRVTCRVRWLAVDPGERRVGLAVCDPDERVAVPLEIVPADAAFPAIRSIVAREGIEGIVMGLPLTLRGDEGEAVRMARRLGARIVRQLAVPLEYEDERHTTSEAERLAGRDRPSDDLAAAILLQQFIDRRRAAGGRTDQEDRGPDACA
ncbi:MAG: Holliday junction resolvase RuvX [Dehalococcoidia bacterium]|nr:Holliday junction resolvase RuvX [Dehalococcoidia bacterium]